VWRHGAWRIEKTVVRFTPEYMKTVREPMGMEWFKTEDCKKVFTEDPQRMNLVEGITREVKEYSKINILFGVKRQYHDYSF
jgi:hypothetical protein